MRTRCAIIVVSLSAVLACYGCARTGTVRTRAPGPDLPEERAALEIQKPREFPTRKRLIFHMAWNRIPVGRIIAESKDIINYKGRDVYVVTLFTESNRFLSHIYRVEDTYTSYVDTITMTSRRYEADRKEGTYRKHVIVEYDFEKMEAIYTNLTDGSVKTCSIEDDVHDPVSVICSFMTLPVKAGDRVDMTVNLNEKNYDIYAQIGGVEAIRLPGLGTRAGYKVTPYFKLDGEEVRKGRAWIYASADADRYPLFGVVIIPFGRITATLVAIEDL
jgi:hypothetical protein